jgi:hypothetical protein
MTAECADPPPPPLPPPAIDPADLFTSKNLGYYDTVSVETACRVFHVQAEHQVFAATIDILNKIEDFKYRKDKTFWLSQFYLEKTVEFLQAHCIIRKRSSTCPRTGCCYCCIRDEKGGGLS